MMGMRMIPTMIQAQLLEVVGGATSSIFPQAEGWLLANHDNQRALEYVAYRKTMDNYHSMMDFLFCEVFVEYRKDCFKFYNDKGPLLKNMISAEQILRFDGILLEALKIAHKVFSDDRKVSWKWFRAEALKLVTA